jgi:hypothetical protein
MDTKQYSYCSLEGAQLLAFKDIDGTVAATNNLCMNPVVP